MDVNSILKEVFCQIRRSLGAFLVMGLPFMVFSMWYTPYSQKPIIEFTNPDDTDLVMYNMFFLIFATLFNVLLSVLAAVKFHGIFLQNQTFSIRDYFVLNKRHLLFFIATIQISLLYFLVYVPIEWALEFWFWEYDFWYELSEVTTYLLVLLAGVICAQFALILPAAAVGESISMKQSWQLTSQNRFRVFALLTGIPLITTYSLGFLYFIESDWIIYLDVLVWCVVSLVELGLLSRCYQHLKNQYLNTV